MITKHAVQSLQCLNSKGSVLSGPVCVCMQYEGERGFSTSVRSALDLWMFPLILNVMLKLKKSLYAYLGYDLQHQEMKHLHDLCKNGKGYISH